MNTRRTCPDCGEDLNPRAKKCPCGWRVPEAESTAPGRTVPALDLEYGWCAWRSNGERCREPGVVSLSTMGGGQWYCSEHARCTDPQVGGQIVDESIVHRGQRPDYSYARRAAGILAHWRAVWERSDYAKAARSSPRPGEMRQAVDRTVAHLSGRIAA